MNSKKTLTILITSAMIAMGSLASAQDTNTGTVPKPAGEQSVSRVQVKGVIEKTAKGVTLLDGENTYLLECEEDLGSFAGKTVMVTGDGYTSDAGMVILVRQISEFK
ncbi:hypothetical protein [Desulfospira joergensenii]|uniref:hypothetical protein n=1 Tax=Desulfospira joergensenii TaxID=53329 RepID=UPI0003B71859|nr:hypothetical protein [Desulfospira joergensenii]